MIQTNDAFPTKNLLSCPTCGASRSHEKSCYRCGSDLSELLHIEERAVRLFDAGLSAYTCGHFHTAKEFAGESAQLLASRETLQLVACASLRAGDFRGALSAARALRGNPVAAGSP